ARPQQRKAPLSLEPRRPSERSILSPVNASKVTKAPNKRRGPYQKMNDLCSDSQPVAKAATDVGSPDSGRNKAPKTKSSMPASLRSIRPSRISKPSRERSTGQGGSGAKLLKENGLATSSTGKKTMWQSANTPLRRSTRISKQPERFRPG
ncbi:hypothetical protein LTR28_012172, partial [Elasticomyces elasticus]